MSADRLALENPLAEWAAMLTRARKGESRPGDELIQPPPIQLGVTLRSATRRYIGSKIGKGGIYWAPGPVNSDGEPSYRVVELKQQPARVAWETLTADEILWEEYKGIVPRGVLLSLRDGLTVHMAEHQNDPRYLTALGVIARCLS